MRLPSIAVNIALVMALVAFVLGSGPFSPALGLAGLALVIAVVSWFYGVWRTALIVIYWSVAALLAVPMSKAFDLRVDYCLVGLAVAGILGAVYLYVGYVRNKTHPG